VRHPYLTAEWWHIQADLWRIAGPALMALMRLDLDEFEYQAETRGALVRRKRDRLKERWANR
jgi:hypothetical protein